MKFFKFILNGNTFLLTPYEIKQYLISEYCKDSYGASADSLITMSQSEEYDAVIKVYNKDGRLSLVSGNGLLCVGEFLKMIRTNSKGFIIKSDYLSHDLTFEKDLPEVKLGKPKKVNQIEKNHLFNIINLGNDHIIRIVENIDKTDFEGFVKEVRKDSEDNVVIVEIVNASKIRLRVDKHGIGEMLSCGSSAASAVYFLYNEGLLDSSVECEFTGGSSIVRIDALDNVYLKGKPKLVFKGEF